jgi:bacterioferritin (cytochrome b1)
LRLTTQALDNPPRGTDSYLPMSLTEWFWQSPRSRAIDMLASVAGRYRVLAANLRNHAAMCKYPTMRAGLEDLAAIEEEQAEALDGILMLDGRKPSPQPIVQLDGANNWQRLKADLTLQAQMLSDLNQAIVILEGRDHHAAAKLREMATDEERNLGDLRDLVLKCDTQALD